MASGSARAETALGQNTLSMRHKPCTELCTPGMGPSLGCRASGVLSLPSQQGNLASLPGDLGTETIRAVQASLRPTASRT